MKFEIKKVADKFCFQLDEEDAMQFVGIPLMKTSHGYLRVNSSNFKGERYVHRIVMKAQKCEVVDHINGDKMDNRKKNLRICSQADNCLNKVIGKRNKSGVAGVYYDSKREKWAAQISVKKKTISLGRFDTKEEAIAVRLKSQEKYHGEYSSSLGVLKAA